jgi:transcriptional regulator with XRE-family HTH domain
MAVNIDRNPLTHFGRQVRKERLARGWSLREFAARTGMAVAYWSQIENGKRPPTEKVALACDAAFPERRGWFSEYYEESKSWVPASFRSWAEYEDRAVTLRVWCPGFIDGLVQTENYARSLLRTYPGVTDEILAGRLRSRMERQRRVLMREDPSSVWFVIDEAALYRRVGSAEIMAGQMRHLLEVASMPNVTMQVLPAVEHPASASEIIIADDAAYAEHAAAGFTYTEDEPITRLTRLFVTIQGECMKVSESSALFERMIGTWNRLGARAATQQPTAERA